MYKGSGIMYICHRRIVYKGSGIMYICHRRIAYKGSGIMYIRWWNHFFLFSSGCREGDQYTSSPALLSW